MQPADSAASSSAPAMAVVGKPRLFPLCLPIAMVVIRIGLTHQKVE